jgi:ABC-2 type transport system permease protein
MIVRATLALAGRALRTVLRRPQFIAPLVIFPTFFLAVNVGGLSRTTDLPGFPHVNGFLDFQLAGGITQSLLLGGVSAGVAVALEIEMGFFDRLATAPIPRVSMIFGRIGAAAVIAIGQAIYFLAIGLIFGAHIEGGVLGVLLILIIASIAGTGFAAFGVMLALLAKSASTVQGIFPIVFVILFVSSAFFPRALLEQPAKGVAQFNPLSYIADGMRNPIIAPIHWSAVLEGMAAAASLVIVFVTLSVFALRGRLRDA